MTGTHPGISFDCQMWDAMKAWIDRGGRLMYMGGNGWYWRIAFPTSCRASMELRRAEDGIRPWIAEPGEYSDSFNGEYGGFGGASDGRRTSWPASASLRRGSTSRLTIGAPRTHDDPRAAFIFEGVPEEIIGDFGWSAAALRDRARLHHHGWAPRQHAAAGELGGPSGMMLLVNEEFGAVPPNLGGDQKTAGAGRPRPWRDDGGRRLVRRLIDRLVWRAIA